MKKVIAINLNGNAYQVDEDGFNVLRRYLDQAEAQLKDNPDKVEIIADLEQAIGEKCAGFLSAHKTVVTGVEVEQIIKDMGPVDGGISDAQPRAGAEQPATDENAATDAAAPKRLYKVREGAMISGVCMGIAAYLDIDITIVRVVAVILAIVTQGVALLVYLIMMFVVPYATTTEERAAAHGAPFNAQEVIDQAKKHYADFKEQHYATFTDRKAARRQFRAQRREWRREWKHRWRKQSPWWRHEVPPTVAQAVSNASYGGQIVAGVLVPILGIVNVLLFWVWLFAIISLVTTGTVFGWYLPVGMPLWAGFVALIVLYNVCVWPLRAMRRSWYYALRGDSHGSFAAWDGMTWLLLTVAIFWFVYQYSPQVHYVMQHFGAIWSGIWQGFTASAD